MLGAVIPTDEAEDEVGERRWALEPPFFVDAVLGTVAVQGNLIYGFVEGGEQEFEFSASFARPVYFGERFTVGPLLEVMGGGLTRSADPGSGDLEELGVAPGLKLQAEGWHFGVGVRLSLAADDPSDRAAVLTGGCHVRF